MQASPALEANFGSSSSPMGMRRHGRSGLSESSTELSRLTSNFYLVLGGLGGAARREGLDEARAQRRMVIANQAVVDVDEDPDFQRACPPASVNV